MKAWVLLLHLLVPQFVLAQGWHHTANAQVFYNPFGAPDGELLVESTRRALDQLTLLTGATLGYGGGTIHTDKPNAVVISYAPRSQVERYCRKGAAACAVMTSYIDAPYFKNVKILLSDDLPMNCLQAVLLHELGHAYRLDHSEDSTHFMFPGVKCLNTPDS
ncbi:MAG: hypothetical protein SV422_03595 [Pseudomonadota bacterium]|nr:hypothetical protein [Pseudomonadota bacterium]